MLGASVMVDRPSARNPHQVTQEKAPVQDRGSRRWVSYPLYQRYPEGERTAADVTCAPQ